MAEFSLYSSLFGTQRPDCFEDLLPRALLGSFNCRISGDFLGLEVAKSVIAQNFIVRCAQAGSSQSLFQSPFSD